MSTSRHHIANSPIEPAGLPQKDQVESFYVRAQYDFTSPDASALAFIQGDIIEVLTQLPSGWWDGLLNGIRGWFPSNYVERISEDEVEALIADMADDLEGESGVEIMPNGQTRSLPVEKAVEKENGQGSSDRPQPAPDLGLAEGIEIDEEDADWLRREMERDVGFDDLARGLMESSRDEKDEEIEQSSMREARQTQLGEHLAAGKEVEKAEEQEGDYWVPSMTPDGQIYYHNTKTGESSWDLPGVDSATLGDSYDGEEDAYDMSQSFASIEQPSLISHDEFKMPPKNVPEPWQARIDDDGSEWYFVNRVTGERRAELPKESDLTETLAVDTSRLSLQTDLSQFTPASESPQRLSMPPLSQAILNAERQKRQAIEAAYKPLEEATVGALVFAVAEALRDVFDAVGSGTEAEQALGNPRDRNTLTGPLVEQRDEALYHLRVAVGRTTTAVSDLVTAVGFVTLPSPAGSSSVKDDLPILPPWIDDMIKAQWSVSAALSKVVFSVHTASLAATSPDDRSHSDHDSWGDVLRSAGKLRDVATHFPAEAAHIRAAKGDRTMLDSGNSALGRRQHAAFGSHGVGVYGAGQWGFGRGDPDEDKQWVDLDETAAAQVDELKLQVDAAITAAQLALGPAQTESALSLIRIVSRFNGTVGSIDIAGALDLDGESSTPSGTPGGSGSSYNGLVRKAQLTLAAFEASSQVLVDSTACLVLALASGGPKATRERSDLLAMILSSSADVVVGVRGLRRIAVDQDYAVSRGLARGQIGARAYCNRSLTSSRRSSRVSAHNTRPTSLMSSRSRSSRRSKRSSLRSRAVGLEEEFLDMDARDQAQAQSEEHDQFRQSIMYKAPAGSQTSLSGKTRSRSGSNAGGSTAGSDGFTGGSVRSSSAAGLMKAMPFLRNRANSDVDESRTSPSKKSSGNSKKLAKLLGEDTAMGNRPNLPRQPEETPWYLEPNYHASEIVFDDKGGVKAGTLSALVERLTPHQSTDTNFFQAFLTTYRSFATGPEVIELLVKRYLIEPPPELTPEQLNTWQTKKQTPIRLRVINTLKVWLDQHYTETDDPEILHQIRDFAADILPAHGNESSSKQLLNLVSKRLSGEHVARKMVSGAMFAPPASLVPRVPAGRTLRLLDINPIELARQLTILESGRYNRCRPGEFLDCAWSSPDGDVRSPNLKRSIFSSNRMAGWVTETILMHNDTKRRAATMKMWIQTAMECRMLNNFSSMAACIAGVNAAPIERLKRTKDLLSAKTQALKAELDDKLDSSGNFAKYRQLLKTVNPPCVPFLGFYLTMLTFLGDGNADTVMAPVQPGDTALSKPLINFYKRSLTADIIREIQQYQTQPYNLQPCAPILAFIGKSCEDVDKAPDLYELSLSLEPRERDDEKITRMLSESGFI